MKEHTVRKLLIAVFAVVMFTLGTACGPEGDADTGKSTSKTQAANESPFKDFWSYQGSKVSSANPADARQHLIETSLFFDSETINIGKSLGTPHLVVDKFYTSSDEPVGLAVSHPQGDSKLGEELIITTRVDKPGRHKLFDQFRSALGPCAIEFQGALPKGIDDAFWIHNSMGQPTGATYRTDDLTVSMNFGRPQPRQLILGQMKKNAPFMRAIFLSKYGPSATPAS